MFWASLVAQLVNNLPATQETWVQSLGWEDPLEKGKPTHFSILAWRIPWTTHGVAESQTWLSDIHFTSLHSVLSLFSRVRLSAHPWAVACQAPLSLEFYSQRHWSGLPFTSPGDLPNPGIEPASLVSPALAGGFFTSWAALPYKIVVETKWDNPRNTLHVVNIL